VPAELAQRLADRSGRLLEAAQRRVLGRFPGAVVLLYHRVAALETDPFAMALPPEHFDEHLGVIRSSYEPLGLAELARAVRRRRVPRRGVVITFDDGYADNLHAARPVLERHGIPATVFVASGYVGAQREFWWDELERLLRRAAGARAELRLRLRERALVYARLADDGGAAALTELQFALRTSTAGEIDSVLAQLRASVGEPAGPQVREAHRPLRVDELGLLARDALVDIGAHTRSHANLARASRDEQQRELEGSKRDLEQWLGSAVAGFSFPFGRRRRDYTRSTVRLARKVGFELAAVRFPTRVTAASSTMQIPRLVAPAVAGGDFERWLAERFGR